MIAWAGSASAIPFYADTVLGSSQGVQVDGSAIAPARSTPGNALGAPDSVFFSLGFPASEGGSHGWIVLGFSTAITDALVIETTYGYTQSTYPETADIYGSNDDGVSWTFIGQAGIHNNTFTLPTGLNSINAVKIIDTTDPQFFIDKGISNADGFDINAVGGTPVPEPATMLLLGAGLLGLAGIGRKKFKKGRKA